MVEQERGSGEGRWIQRDVELLIAPGAGENDEFGRCTGPGVTVGMIIDWDGGGIRKPLGSQYIDDDKVSDRIEGDGEVIDALPSGIVVTNEDCGGVWVGI